MKSVFDGYVSTQGFENDDVFFAGANTDAGFRSSYAAIAAEESLERLYIIKGSAGCGKSTLMKKIAREAECEGHSVRYYLCGSDAESLDSVVIDGRIAVLDGTPPHSVDMIFPGAKSELVDLSRFLDTAALEREREAIVHHTTAKRRSMSGNGTGNKACALLAAELK
jgi:ABC-type cobalamin/Fe3+-siderophores transport system ATPase subunit